jgi:cytochrome P450
MRRRVQEDIVLSNGLKLKKGDRVGVDSCRMWDEAYHQDPLKYDAERFLKMRQQPGNEHFAQLVTTSSNHLAFGSELFRSCLEHTLR